MMRGALLRAKVKEPAEPIGAFVEFMSLEASRLEMGHPRMYPGVKQEFSMCTFAATWSLPSWLDAGVGVLITEMREAVTSTTKTNRYGQEFWARMKDTPKPAHVGETPPVLPPRKRLKKSMFEGGTTR